MKFHTVHNEGQLQGWETSTELNKTLFRLAILMHLHPGFEMKFKPLRDRTVTVNDFPDANSNLGKWLNWFYAVEETCGTAYGITILNAVFDIQFKTTTKIWPNLKTGSTAT